MHLIATLLRFLLLISFSSAAHLYNRNTVTRLFSRDVQNTNWAGAVYDTLSAHTFSGVSGTFTLPSPSSGPCLATILVGLDGVSCDTSFMAGIDVGYNESIIYTALYGWYPTTYKASNFNPPNPGDQIRVTLSATSETSGVVTFYNVNTGISVTENISGSSALCNANAEWVVQQSYITGGSQVALCDFGAVTFTNTNASLVNNGGHMTAGKADKWEIVDAEGYPLTSVTITGNSDVDILYTGIQP